MEKILRKFKDIAQYSESEKTVISVRDGLLEYLGVELGLEPPEKTFTVYRSPATIANAAQKMMGIPLTNEHVDIDAVVADKKGCVDEATMIDMFDDDTETKLAIKNRIKIDDEVKDIIKDKRELSLGYLADLIPHSIYDFEQTNIRPHHLAIVANGRCGELCSFLDKKPKKEKEMPKNKAFTDENGEVNLEQVVDIAMALPDVLRTLPLDKLKEVMPSLQEIVKMASVSTEGEITDEDKDKEKDVEAEDEEKGKEEDDENKPKFSDADLKKAIEEKSKAFADEQVALYSHAIDKARHFLDAEYDFTKKNTNEIMRDALSTESTESFSDDELAVAFKFLKKTANYKEFGDKQAEHPLDAIAEKEL